MSVSSTVNGKVSSRKAIMRKTPKESMTLFLSKESSSLTSEMPRAWAYSSTNVRTGPLMSIEFASVLITPPSFICASLQKNCNAERHRTGRQSEIIRDVVLGYGTVRRDIENVHQAVSINHV